MNDEQNGLNCGGDGIRTPDFRTPPPFTDEVLPLTVPPVIVNVLLSMYTPPPP